MSVSLSQTFYADTVLFDMDGTLTDSIQAVEAAWGRVAIEIGQEPAKVIAATHGKRAVDNLAQFKPHIKPHEMDDEVAKFEESILYFADAYNLHGPGSFREYYSPASSSTGADTPSLTPDDASSTSASSRTSSIVASQTCRPSFANALSESLLPFSLRNEPAGADSKISDTFLDDFEGQQVEATSIDRSTRILLEDELDDDLQFPDVFVDELEQWQIEAASVDRSVRILPGVRKMIDSLPEGRYAVATSGARTYAYGCMTRVGIIPPPVTITADDKRLKAGKPAPDPFLLAAECLGYNASDCIVFEDSPSGIRAGVASGATVIALCTSHERSQIEECGAHYIVENMEQVKCEIENDRLKFTISG